LDFYISSKFKPYLIECNANPCLEVNCPILERIIPGAIEHGFRLGLDPLFPPPWHYPPSTRYQLCDKIIEKLKYELIFD
jgi:tubulin monoglycylase TTLL3/8